MVSGLNSPLLSFRFDEKGPENLADIFDLVIFSVITGQTTSTAIQHSQQVVTSHV